MAVGAGGKAVENHPGPHHIQVHFRVIDHSGAVAAVADAGGDAPLLQLGEGFLEPLELELGKGNRFRVILIGHRKVGKGASDGEIGHFGDLPNFIQRAVQILPVGEESQPGHAGVKFDVDFQHVLTGLGDLLEGAGVFQGGDHLGDVVAGEKTGHLHRGGPKDQGGVADAVAAKADGLVDVGDAKPIHPCTGHGSGDKPVPVAVGIGLDHRHQAASRGQTGADGGDIPADGVQVDGGPASL